MVCVKKKPDLYPPPHYSEVSNEASEYSFSQTQTTNAPRKINMKPEKDDLEDDFPFQLGDCFGSSR